MSKQKDKNKTNDLAFRHLLHPKHWITWIAVGFLWVIIKTFPHTWLMRLGVLLVFPMKKLMKYRLLIAKTNINLCFKTIQQNNKQAYVSSNADSTTSAMQTADDIYEAHLISLGKGFIEGLTGCFLSKPFFSDKVSFTGTEHPDKAYAENRGILLMGIHTTSIGIISNLINERYLGIAMYRPSKNPVFDYLITRGRLKHTKKVIQQNDLKSLMSSLKDGDMIWYGTDQDFGSNAKCTFAPFYGVEAYTLTLYKKIAEKTNAAIIPVSILREDNDQYSVNFLPEIDIKTIQTEDYAALVANQTMEQMLLGKEEQYYWVHRRFKTRPNGEPKIYPKKPSRLKRQTKN